MDPDFLEKFEAQCSSMEESVRNLNRADQTVAIATLSRLADRLHQRCSPDRPALLEHPQLLDDLRQDAASKDGVALNWAVWYAEQVIDIRWLAGNVVKRMPDTRQRIVELLRAMADQLEAGADSLDPL